MSDDTNDNIESLNDTAQGDDTNLDEVSEDTVADTEVGSDDVDELKEKLSITQKQNQKLFERAKKAEGFEKQPDGSWVKVHKSKAEPKEVKETRKDDLSSTDVYALIDAKVPREDIDEVKEYARFKGISVTEALSSNVVKTILSEKSELRRTANATNTGPTRRGSDKISVETLKEKAARGELPDSDQDLDRLLEDRYTKK